MTIAVHRRAAAVLAAAAALGAVWAAPAGAAQDRVHVRTTCARQTRVLSTPGGLVVGFLARGAPVIVLAHTRNGSWAEIRAVHSTVGWIRSRDLC